MRIPFACLLLSGEEGECYEEEPRPLHDEEEMTRERRGDKVRPKRGETKGGAAQERHLR